MKTTIKVIGGWLLGTIIFGSIVGMIWFAVETAITAVEAARWYPAVDAYITAHPLAMIWFLFAFIGGIAGAVTVFQSEMRGQGEA